MTWKELNNDESESVDINRWADLNSNRDSIPRIRDCHIARACSVKRRSQIGNSYLITPRSCANDTDSKRSYWLRDHCPIRKIRNKTSFSRRRVRSSNQVRRNRPNSPLE